MNSEGSAAACTELQKLRRVGVKTMWALEILNRNKVIAQERATQVSLAM